MNVVRQYSLVRIVKLDDQVTGVRYPTLARPALRPTHNTISWVMGKFYLSYIRRVGVENKLLILISNFRRALNVVFFLLGDSQIT